MTAEDKLRDLIVSRYGTVKHFAEICDLPYTTVDSILRRGARNAGISNIFKICDVLKIDERALVNQEIVPIVEITPDKSDIQLSEFSNCESETEIDDLISITKLNIQETDNLTIDGQRMTEAEIEMLIDGIDITVEIIRRKRSRRKAKEGAI